MVPVFGAAEALDRCLGALADATDLERHPLALCLDGPQPSEVEAAIERRSGGLGAFEVLRAPERRGFPATANRGLAHYADRDVVLLNSDTEVTAGWLERLSLAARSAPDVASVTPLTNHGTLASIPRWFEENALPAGHTAASFAQTIERTSPRRRPRIPTGVGFCLYLRREALDAIGRFDEATFGQGYGEEVDWCQRALAAGYVHLLDDATFVWHEGGASFGGAARARVRRAQRALRRRHPGYEARLARFMGENPLREVHETIAAALAPPADVADAPTVTATGDRLRVAHVVHGWPPWNHAGTEVYAHRLVGAFAARHDQVVYTRYAPPDRPFGHALERLDRGARVRLVANAFDQRDPFARNALHSRALRRDFGALLDETRPDVVHVHHLAGHCLTLPSEAARRGIPILWQLQDWWSYCARANRLDRDRRLCDGPGAARCSRCLPATRIAPATLWSPLLYALRRALARRSLRLAAAFVAGSEAVVADHRRLGLIPPETPAHVLDYGVPDLPRVAPGRRHETPKLRLGFVGTLAPHKGLHVAARALAELPKPAAGRVRLDVWGEPREGPYAEEVRRLAEGVDLRFHPPFAEGALAEALAGLDLLIAPSLGLESFGLAVAEALAAGVPVLASRRGALVERLARGGGALFDPDRPETLGELLRHALDEPDQLEAWRRETPPQAPFADHVEAIDGIYREIRGRARR